MEQRSEQNVCILVVDDEQDIRRIIRILLESSGYQVAEAPYGLAAVKKERGSGLYAADASALFKRAEKNPVVTAMLSDFGPQWCHDHLHVHYGKDD